jgi:hypothetical protein
MRGSREGVISMPVKLMVSFLIIALMVPVITTTVENVQNGMEDKGMMDVAEQLRSSMSKVSSRNGGFILQVELDVPDNGHLVIGEGSGRTISVYRNDERISDIVTDFAVEGGPKVLYGNMLLQISNGENGVVVREL